MNKVHWTFFCYNGLVAAICCPFFLWIWWAQYGLPQTFSEWAVYLLGPLFIFFFGDVLRHGCFKHLQSIPTWAYYFVYFISALFLIGLLTGIASLFTNDKYIFAILPNIALMSVLIGYVLPRVNKGALETTNVESKL